MSGNTNKNDSHTGDALRVPLLEVQPVPSPVPVPVVVSVGDDLEALPIPRARPLEVVGNGTSTGGNDSSNNSNINNNNNNNIRNTTAMATAVNIDESDWDHGVVQPKACRDCLWGFLFLLQLAVVATLSVMGIRNAIKHGSEWIDDGDDDGGSGGQDDKFNKHAILFVVSLLSIVIAVPSILLNLLLGPFSSMLIQISLVVSPLSMFVGFVVSLITMNCPVALFSLIFFVMGVFYATSVWHKVPFATANLTIALASIKDNHGLWILAYAVTFKSYAWIVLWCSAVLEMVYFSPEWVYDCGSDSDDWSNAICTISTRGKFLAFGMLLSLFWTCQVISNMFHTTIAGVVGTWWFDPEEARSASAQGRSGGLFGFCGCSPAIWNSYLRSGIHSLGSIAFGSFLIAVLKVVQIVVRCGRQQRDAQRRARSIQGTDFLFCLLQYFVDQLERLMQYVNVWAFVYVGLYGYDYWTAGKQVATLFKARGWDVIITDNLVSRSLSMMSLLISGITGLLGMVVGFFLLGTAEAMQGLVLGFLLGGSSCQILFGVVTSAVNTVVVCFAESPNHLNQNGHDPEHFPGLVQAYRTAYPNECGF